MVVNLSNLLIALGIIAASYIVGFVIVWNGPFSWNRELAAKWPVSIFELGVHFPVLGIILSAPFVAAFFLLVTDRNRKVGFGLLVLGCVFSNGWIALSLHIHD